MDAKQFGTFIAERRKELGLTQAALAEKIHVTDKAISKWERGVGLPDINSIEVLADSLEVSLIELMQGKKNEEKTISKKEAEELLLDTIQLSKTANDIIRFIGSSILFIFVGISAFLLFASIGLKEIPLNVISIIFGLIAWGMPIWHIALAKTRRTTVATVISFSCVLISLISQFYELARRVHMSDWSALMDTIDFLTIVVIFLSITTMILNIFMIVLSKYKRK